MKVCAVAVYKFNSILSLHFTYCAIRSKELTQKFGQKTYFPGILNFVPAPPPPHPKLFCCSVQKKLWIYYVASLFLRCLFFFYLWQLLNFL